MSDARVSLPEIDDLACAPLLRLLTEEVLRLDAAVQPEVGAYGVRFRLGERLLCEFSVFGELFIARIGPQSAVEYRVRSLEVARVVLHEVLCEYLDRRAALPR
jgi:hypothetical protein